MTCIILPPPQPCADGRSTPASRLTLEKVLRRGGRLLHGTKPGAEVQLMQSLLDALRAIVLHIEDVSPRADAEPPQEPSPASRRIVRSVEELAAALGLESGRLAREPIGVDCARIVREVLAGSADYALRSLRETPYPAYVRGLVVCALLGAMREGKQFHRRVLRACGVSLKWREWLKAGWLDYQLMFCRYILELVAIRLDRQITPTLRPEFYTELGRCAFNLFTRDSFVGILQELDDKAPVRRVLDIGCGHGDYLDAARGLPEIESAVGVELQPRVAASTAERFLADPRVTIANSDFRELEGEGDYDLVMLNYVTFYMDDASKHELLSWAKKRLSPTGVVLICQYYPDLPQVQAALSRAHGATGLIARTERYFTNILLRAEVLLNDSIDEFSGAERWEKFAETADRAQLDPLGFARADGYFYSLFVLLGAREPSGDRPDALAEHRRAADGAVRAC